MNSNKKKIWGVVIGEPKVIKEATKIYLHRVGNFCSGLDEATLFFTRKEADDFAKMKIKQWVDWNFHVRKFHPGKDKAAA